jgi:hypothetical protein
MTYASEKGIYVETLQTKKEVISARDWMESNWNEKMRPEMIRLALVCNSLFKCKLSELK